jgi:hypothetical protein
MGAAWGETLMTRVLGCGRGGAESPFHVKRGARSLDKAQNHLPQILLVLYLGRFQRLVSWCGTRAVGSTRYGQDLALANPVMFHVKHAGS